MFSGGVAEGPLWESVDFYRRAGAGEAFLASFRRRTSGFTKLVEPLPRSFHRLRDGDVLTIGGSRYLLVEFTRRHLLTAGSSPERLFALIESLGYRLHEYEPRRRRLTRITDLSFEHKNLVALR